MTQLFTRATDEKKLDNIRKFHGGEHTTTCEAEGGECPVCSILDCPEHEPLHYHHDGCPCCTSPVKP